MSKELIHTSPHLDQDILEESIIYLKELYGKTESLSFHSFRHSEEVAEVAYKLGKKHKLSDDDALTVQLASWFYYAGYSDNPREFRKEGFRIAESFLVNKVDNTILQQLRQLLVNHNELIKSGDLRAHVLHDALISFKGRKRFFRKAELLRVERSKMFDKNYSDYEWNKLLFELLIKTEFKTDEGQKRYEKKRIQNISDQRDLLNKAKKITTRKKTGKDFGRGVDTLYRSSYRNHINLSSIADGKANMMISINTIILSVIVTLSGAGFTFSGNYIVENIRYTVPIFLLLMTSLSSVIFAILSAKPKVTSKKPDIEKIDEKKTSLLYFGNFLNIGLPKYVEHLRSLKQNQQKLYDSMSIDIYYLGAVLDEKFRLLKWSYNTFMYGLVLSVIAFIVIFLYTNS